MVQIVKFGASLSTFITLTQGLYSYHTYCRHITNTLVIKGLYDVEFDNVAVIKVCSQHIHV